MTREPLVIHFEGEAVARQRLALRDLILFGNHFQSALDRVARLLRGDPASAVPGRRPGDVERMSALEIVSLRGGGSVTIVCDVPPSAVPPLPNLPDPAGEALRTLVVGLGTIAGEGDTLPSGFDKGVLLSLREAGKVFDKGFSKITLSLPASPSRARVDWTRPAYLEMVRRIQAPVRNRRVLEGRLLMADFRESSLRCRVHPPVGAPVSCEFEESQRDAVLSALTHYVRVVGEATELDDHVQALRIEDIEMLDPDATPGTSGLTRPFSVGPPMSLLALAEAKGARPVQDPNMLFGDFWPEEEDLEEFLHAVARWRREGSDERLA